MRHYDTFQFMNYGAKTRSYLVRPFYEENQEAIHVNEHEIYTPIPLATEQEADRNRQYRIQSEPIFTRERMRRIRADIRFKRALLELTREFGSAAALENAKDWMSKTQRIRAEVRIAKSIKHLSDRQSKLLIKNRRK